LVLMGSYGFGLGRLMGTVVELYHDEAGIRWPKSIAPYSIHLLELNDAKGEQLYVSLQREGIQVLYDDRDMSAGQKLVESDLIGIPWRLAVSPKLGGGKVELKQRGEERTEIIAAQVPEILKRIAA
ncbi:MAG: His/Gly/Thr/Pro-type tRNA ligase C-terminal domain-containing protein, partial [Patescibacteria group bacterium]